jgi:hypothetical protein
MVEVMAGTKVERESIKNVQILILVRGEILSVAGEAYD